MVAEQPWTLVLWAGEALVESQNRDRPDDRDVRCQYGQLVARWIHCGVEMKCKRCRRLVRIPFSSLKGIPPARFD